MLWTGTSAGAQPGGHPLWHDQRSAQYPDGYCGAGALGSGLAYFCIWPDVDQASELPVQPVSVHERAAVGRGFL
jgi:hypothetical protein